MVDADLLSVAAGTIGHLVESYDLAHGHDEDEHAEVQASAERVIARLIAAAREIREAKPVTVLAVPFELLRVAGGNPVTFGVLEGGEAVVRLPTVDEMLDMHRRACTEVGAEPTLTRPDAERLVKPLPI